MYLYCKYCNKKYHLESGLLSCPSGKKNFHVLSPSFDDGNINSSGFSENLNPFLFFKNLITSFSLYDEKSYISVLNKIDSGLEKTEEKPFKITPLLKSAKLENNLNLPKGSLFIKDETGNVTGSHKGRHAMGNLLYVEGLRQKHLGNNQKKCLAIYSCGNAALGAAAISQSLGYKIYTFVPESVSSEVEKRLVYYGAKVVKVERGNAGKGDPCYNRFHEAIQTLGFLPFSCSGPDNWPNIEGGATIFYETVFQMISMKAGELDKIFIQVGGGALASAVIYAAMMLKKAGVILKLPQIICVQTESCYPLSLSFEKVKKMKRNSKLSTPDFMQKIGLKGGNYMSAWRKNIPESLAEGILDDITYDWLNVVEGLLESEGRVVVVEENLVKKAYELGKAAGFNVSATGTAGLAGLLKLLKLKKINKGEKIGLFFTGIDQREKLSGNFSSAITLKQGEPIKKILDI